MLTGMAYYKTLAKKRMGAGAIFINKTGQILLVKPTYKDGWQVPGGTVDADESPKSTVTREVKEELGLDIPISRLLCVDYVYKSEEQDENLQWIFYGGILDETQIKNIKLPKEELEEYRFCTPEEAVRICSYKMGRRMPLCLKAIEENKTFYLEDQEEI